MEYIVLIISIIGCYFISALIHELGHIIYGLINHWKLFMLVVGPIKIYRENINSKLKIGIEKNITLWCGVGGTFPIKKSEDNIKVWARILLAGPLTSITFGILMLPLFFHTKNIILLMLSLMPIAMGIMCIIPMKMKTGLLYNDGTRYKRLKNGGQEQLEEMSIFQLSEITIFDGEDILFPEILIVPLLDSKDYELNYYGYYYSYKNAMRANKLDEANMQLSNMEKIKGKVPKIIIDDCKI